MMIDADFIKFDSDGNKACVGVDDCQRSYRVVAVFPSNWVFAELEALETGERIADMESELRALKRRVRCVILWAKKSRWFGRRLAGQFGEIANGEAAVEQGLFGVELVKND